MVNQETIKGRWTEVKGKLQERWGQLTNDPALRFEGDVNSLVGHIQTRTGETREKIENYLEEIVCEDTGSTMQAVSDKANAVAASAMEQTQKAAETVSTAVQDGIHQTEETVRRHPMEALAVCFGVGLVAGVVIGVATLGGRSR